MIIINGLRLHVPSDREPRYEVWFDGDGPTARYVRIRLDAPLALHFRCCQIRLWHLDSE